MKSKILGWGSLVLALGLTACGNSEDTAETENESVEICTYSYNAESTDFEFTSYKTSDKVPVKGSFNEIIVESELGNNPLEVIESLEFTMVTNSVETNDEGRNGKISEFFFGTINTSEITGKVASIDEENSMATITINMNGIAFDVEGDYTIDGNKFSWNSTIDVASWNGLSGIEALNEVCKDLHTGADGVSKLWPEVSLSFSTIVNSDCD